MGLQQPLKFKTKFYIRGRNLIWLIMTEPIHNLMLVCRFGMYTEHFLKF